VAHQAALSTETPGGISHLKSVATATALGLLVAVALVVAFVRNDHSSYYVIVDKDRSWLGYLPATGSGNINIVGLNTESSGVDQIRRVDIAEPTQDQVVSLCFAASRRDLRATCPGFRFLGWTDRDVEYRAVGQLGDDSVNWLEELGNRTPRLADLHYLDE
jgi:hypothetical protein